MTRQRIPFHSTYKQIILTTFDLLQEYKIHSRYVNTHKAAGCVALGAKDTLDTSECIDGRIHRCFLQDQKGRWWNKRPPNMYLCINVFKELP